MINKNYILITILTCFAFTSSVNNNVYKKFGGGRSGYSEISLTLNTDSSYNYYQWSHHRLTTIEDSGTWKIIDTFLLLNSYHSQTITKSVPKKRQKRKRKILFETVKETFTVFEKDSFLYMNKEIYLFDLKKLKNEGDSSYYFTYRILYEE